MFIKLCLKILPKIILIIAHSNDYSNNTRRSSSYRPMSSIIMPPIKMPNVCMITIFNVSRPRFSSGTKSANAIYKNVPAVPEYIHRTNDESTPTINKPTTMPTKLSTDEIMFRKMARRKLTPVCNNNAKSPSSCGSSWHNTANASIKKK